MELGVQQTLLCPGVGKVALLIAVYMTTFLPILIRTLGSQRRLQ